MNEVLQSIGSNVLTALAYALVVAFVTALFKILSKYIKTKELKEALDILQQAIEEQVKKMMQENVEDWKEKSTSFKLSSDQKMRAKSAVREGVHKRLPATVLKSLKPMGDLDLVINDGIEAAVFNAKVKYEKKECV